MITGTVKWFNKTKGYGFVEPADGGKDVFVHMSALEASGLDNLSEGQTVNLEVEMGEKGPQATKVSVDG